MGRRTAACGLGGRARPRRGRAAGVGGRALARLRGHAPRGGRHAFAAAERVQGLLDTEPLADVRVNVTIAASDESRVRRSGTRLRICSLHEETTAIEPVRLD